MTIGGSAGVGRGAWVTGCVAGARGTALGATAGSPCCTGSGGFGAGTKSTLMLSIGGSRRACGMGSNITAASSDRCSRQDAPTLRCKSACTPCDGESTEADTTPVLLAAAVGSIVTIGGRKAGFRQNARTTTPKTQGQQCGSLVMNGSDAFAKRGAVDRQQPRSEKLIQRVREQIRKARPSHWPGFLFVPAISRWPGRSAAWRHRPHRAGRSGLRQASWPSTAVASSKRDCRPGWC